MEYRIITALSGADFIRLRQLYIEAGWISPDDPALFLHPAVAGSCAAVGAFDENNHLTGFARALSDGCSDAYIQDVVVAPECRGQGIGRKLIDTIAAELRRRGVDWIGLVGEPGTEPFYRKQGFQAKPGYTLWMIPEEQ